MLVSDDEIAASVISPHFDAVRDVFAEYSPEPGAAPLDRLRGVKLVVDASIRDSERHYAGCRDDGLQVLMAPEAADLPTATLVAILVHEFGHATDFRYPGQWLFEARDMPARWIDPENTRLSRKARKLWHSRDDDQVEWTADAIGYAVTGKQIGYCGRCMIQCFDGGRLRPAGLR